MYDIIYLINKITWRWAEHFTCEKMADGCEGCQRLEAK